MAVRISGPIRLKKTRFLVNRIDTLPVPQKRDFAKYLRYKSREAWDSEYSLDPNVPVQFTLHSLFHESFKSRLPDCDGLAWVAKRMLDGAVDAKLIVDDSPEYVVRVILEAPLISSPADDETMIAYPVAFQGVLDQIGR